MEIDYGRLDALEAALGGRAAIEAAFERGAPMVPRLYRKDFSFDTPGLHNGVAIYTPKVGEILLDAWCAVGTDFDAVASVDAATEDWFDATDDYGWWGYWANAQDLTTSVIDHPDIFSTAYNAPASLRDLSAQYTAQHQLRVPAIASVPSSEQDLDITRQTIGSRVVPAIFRTARPVRLVVSQDGKRGGAAIASTTGEATLYLEIAAASPAPG